MSHSVTNSRNKNIAPYLGSGNYLPMILILMYRFELISHTIYHPVPFLTPDISGIQYWRLGPFWRGKKMQCFVEARRGDTILYVEEVEEVEEVGPGYEHSTLTVEHSTLRSLHCTSTSYRHTNWRNLFNPLQSRLLPSRVKTDIWNRSTSGTSH